MQSIRPLKYTDEEWEGESEPGRMGDFRAASVAGVQAV
jgi:hypothetical protein